MQKMELDRNTTKWEKMVTFFELSHEMPLDFALFRENFTEFYRAHLAKFTRWFFNFEGIAE